VAGFGRWDDAARNVADQLPAEPPLARPTAPEAERTAARPAPEPMMLADHQIALPFEGAGRRLMVPVVFSQGGQEREVQMMLDTGATYTTLPLALLSDLGIAPREDSPTLTLHTANGERQAQLVLLDAAWLGDLQLSNVAIAVCDACGSDDVAGLLGLNITGGFNLNIDADREEVVFTRRPAFGRHLDVRPFLDVKASFVRFAGGRIEAKLEVHNLADREVKEAQVQVTCDRESFQLPTGPLAPSEEKVVLRRLPSHPPCSAYQVSVTDAEW
jgi:clan AA aspartic protease (TIGR02281 family)